MYAVQVRLVGRRHDQPNRILLCDEEGRYFLRSECGSRPVRITSRDAERLIRQYRYDPVEDQGWYPASGISMLGCSLPVMDTYDAAAGQTNEQAG